MRLFFVFLFALFSVVNCYKILIYNPKFGISHVTFSGKIADTLAAAGHEVVVYQPELRAEITFTGSKHKSIRYISMPRNESGGEVLKLSNTMQAIQDRMWEEQSMTKMISMMSTFHKLGETFCDEVMNDNENLKKLKAENFDLGMTELFNACGLGIFHKIGLKKYITTMGGALSPSSASLLGIKMHPSYIPGMMSSSTDQMTFFERVKSFVGYFVENAFLANMFTKGSEIAIRKQFPNFDIADAVADSAFYFVNSDEHIDYAQPITHKIIYMAGLGKIQAKPLEKEYTDIFDSAKKGVILFSFGSVAQSHKMPAEMKKSFLEAFAKFPEINFIWKYEKDEDQIAKGYKNVFTGKWLPQNDILDHPKLLAFISHGGMNSVMEGSTKGVPMICIPVFGDQNHNSIFLVRRGTAIKLEKSEISKESVVAAIKEIITNEKYSKNAKLLSKMVAAKPTKAEERVVKYAEFAAQFGDTGTLQTQGRYQSFWVLYSIDVITFLVTVIAIAIILIIFVVKKMLNVLKRIFQTKQKKN
uniref:glucuronosyltransferase n=1 Tax=Panagrolaimus davidi TaxID=227884 RepID=A0A914PUN9_9BILA